MKLLKSLLDFYINSSLHVALSVISLTYMTGLNYNVHVGFNFLMFVFFATITGYNFVKFYGLAKFHHRSLANWLKSIQGFSFLCFILMFFYATKLRNLTLYFTGVLALITFLYAIPVGPKRFIYDIRPNLRSVAGLKIYIIALVWTAVTVILPLIQLNINLDADVFVYGCQRFLFVVVLMLPFEIRDLRYDSLKLSTLPQSIGVKGTKILGGILLAVFFLLEFLNRALFSYETLVVFVISVMTLACLIFAKVNQGKYYSAFWVEGLPIFWLVMLLFRP